MKKITWNIDISIWFKRCSRYYLLRYLRLLHRLFLPFIKAPRNWTCSYHHRSISLVLDQATICQKINQITGQEISIRVGFLIIPRIGGIVFSYRDTSYILINPNAYRNILLNRGLDSFKKELVKVLVHEVRHILQGLDTSNPDIFRSSLIMCVLLRVRYISLLAQLGLLLLEEEYRNHWSEQDADAYANEHVMDWLETILII